MNLPIMRLELEGMKHTLAVALEQYTIQLDKDIKEAIERYCTEDNLQHIVAETVNRNLDTIIKEEVTKFFRYGEGRAVVANAVKKKLLSNTTFTPLDEV